MKVRAAATWGRERRWHARALTALWMTVLFVSSVAVADWTAFIPRPFENGAFVDAYASFERDRLSSGGSRSRWTDIFFRERLTLLSNGYSYHPRFVQYRFSISGALRQENYDSSALGSFGWQNDVGMEYDTGLLFLPEHPYNLEVYARRYEPLLKEQAAPQHSNVESRQGADFRYREKPYFAHAGYLHSNVESGLTSSDVQQVNLDGQYFKRFTSGNEFSVSGAYNPVWFTASEGVEGNSTTYLLTNYFSLDDVPAWAVPLRVTSSLTQDQFEQQSPTSGTLDSDQFVWYEWATATLPLNFRSDLYYRYQTNSNTAPGLDQSTTANDLKADLIHRLYESVDTTYMFLDNSVSSPGGDSTFLGHSLILNYTKMIPRGRILAGANVATGDTKSEGQIDANASFSATVPMLQPYILGPPNPTVTAVYLRNPLPPFDLVLLDPSFYLVIPIQNTAGIQVTGVPPPYDIGPGPYEFLVFYSYAGDFTLRTNTFGSNASVELFDNLVTPYFYYLAIRSDVLSGTFPGDPVDSTTYTGGLILRFWDLQVRGEYQKLEWDVSPYESWRAEVQYVTALNDTTSVFASGAYLYRHYPQGTSVYDTAAFTEQTETATASIQKALFSRDLHLSIGGSFARGHGQIDSTAYSGNSSLTWRIGKVDLILGANAYQSESSGSTTATTQHDHEFVYLNIRRYLY